MVRFGRSHWLPCMTARNFSSRNMLWRQHLASRSQILGRWIEKAGQRRRRYYRLTPVGANVLASQRDTWREFVLAISRITGMDHA